jgi:hypothetical protein
MNGENFYPAETGDGSIQANIENLICSFRGHQVMIDRDIAMLYGVETKRLNEQVKRNIERFPADFMFQLRKDEKRELVANCDRFNSLKHSSVMPYAFTEQGIAMLSSVLRSPQAVDANIQIMRAFVQMRKFAQNTQLLFSEVVSIKQHQIQADERIDELFSLMDRYNIEEKQGVFFQGQIFDAYAKFESFIQSASKEIILIDGYVDLTVLERLAKKRKGVSVTIFTDPRTPLTGLDLDRFNAQYPTLTLNHTTTMHDRFMIIDGAVLYHIGASLKDLGKKCFAFEVLDAAIIPAILQNL